MKALIAWVLLGVVILMVHQALLWHLHAHDTAGQLLAHGPHTAPGAVWVVEVFFLTRLMLVLGLPVILTCRLVAWAMAHRDRKLSLRSTDA